MALLIFSLPLIWDLLSRSGGGSLKSRYIYGLSRMLSAAGAEDQSRKLVYKAWSVDEVNFTIRANDWDQKREILELVEMAHSCGDAVWGYSTSLGSSNSNDTYFSCQRMDLDVYVRYIKKAGGVVIYPNH